MIKKFFPPSFLAFISNVESNIFYAKVDDASRETGRMKNGPLIGTKTNSRI